MRWHIPKAQKCLIADRASMQMQIPSSTILKALHKCLRLYANKVPLLQALKTDDQPRQKELVVRMLESMNSESKVLKCICFRDEPTIHISGMLIDAIHEYGFGESSRNQRTLAIYF